MACNNLSEVVGTGIPPSVTTVVLTCCAFEILKNMLYQLI